MCKTVIIDVVMCECTKCHIQSNGNYRNAGWCTTGTKVIVQAILDDGWCYH